jgi:soluble lytic murein transglycosylase
MIGMARKSKRKRRAALAVLLCVLLLGAAVTLGSIWSLYRAYPYDNRDAIEESAAEFGQDPLLVAAVIRTESGWRPGAVSSVGATGLMQVMPDTGSWIAKLNGWDYSEDMLKKPDYNIRLGCWYLKYLSDKFGGDLAVTLAAYNAGDNKVKQWISEGRYKDGKLDIPYQETRSFVTKVENAYEKYQFLYKSR